MPDVGVDILPLLVELLLDDGDLLRRFKVGPGRAAEPDGLNLEVKEDFSSELSQFVPPAQRVRFIRPNIFI